MADAVVVDPSILSNIQFATPAEDAEMQVVDKVDKQVISKTWKPQRTISAVCSGGNFEFSKNADFAYSLHDGKVHVCDTANMNIEKVIEFDNEYFITFTVRDNMIVTTGKNGGLRVWNLDTSTCLKYIGTGGSIVIDMKLDASATYLACGTADRKVKVFDIRRNKMTHEFAGHKLSVSLIRWLPNKELQKDKMMLYSVSEEGTIKVWDLVLNACIGTMKYHRSQIPSIVFTNDCKTLIVSSRDQKLSFWNLEQNKFDRLGAIQLEEDVEGMQYVNLEVADDKNVPYLITGGTDGILKILDVNNQKYVYQEQDPLKQEIEKVFYIKQSNQIMTLTNDQVLTYYNLSVNTEKELPQLERLYSLCLYNDEIIDVKYLKCKEDHIVMCSNSELVKVVDMQTQRNKLLTGHDDIIIAVDTYEDFFVTGSKDKTCRVWKQVHFEDGTDQFVCIGVFEGHNMSITGLSIEPKKGSYFVSCSQDNTIKKWSLTDIVNQDYLKNPEKFPIIVNEAQASEVAHQKYINVVKVSPGEKNKLVATASHDRSIKIWTAHTFELKVTLKGHKRGIWDVAFSPYERIIASASSDKTIKLWNVASGQCLNTLEGHLNSTVKVLWINEGVQLFSAGSEGTCKIWNVKKSTCINTFDEHEDKIWAMDCIDDKLITGGSDSKLIEWRDVTQEVEEEEYQEVAKQAHDERILTSMIYEGKYKLAAIQAFKLKKNRDLFKVIEIILDRTKDKPSEQTNDSVMAILDNETNFDSQFQGSDVKEFVDNSANTAELMIKEIVQEMLKIDSMRLLEIIRDLNVHQKYCRIAQILMFQIFKLFGLSKFIDFIETQFKEQNELLVKENKDEANTLSRKGLIQKIKDYFTIISFYSQKHMERIERNQKLSCLVSFVVSKYTVEQEKSEMHGTKKREIKASQKAALVN